MLSLKTEIYHLLGRSRTMCFDTNINLKCFFIYIYIKFVFVAIEIQHKMCQVIKLNQKHLFFLKFLRENNRGK